MFDSFYEENFCDAELGYESEAESRTYSDQVCSDVEIELYSQIHHSQSIDHRVNTSDVVSPTIDVAEPPKLTLPRRNLKRCKKPSRKMKKMLQSTPINKNTYDSFRELLEKVSSEDDSVVDIISSHKTSSTKPKNKTLRSKEGPKSYRDRVKVPKRKSPKCSSEDDKSSEESVIYLESSDDCKEQDVVTNIFNGQEKSKKHRLGLSKSLNGIDENFLPVVVDEVSSSSEASAIENIEVLPSTSTFKPPPGGIMQTRALWMINHEDLYYNSRKIKRYFTQSASCSICKDATHYAKDCPLPAKCYLCGGNHASRVCQQKLCSSCLAPGHNAKLCRQAKSCICCSLCNIQGHESSRCPDIWRRYHLTTTPNTILSPNCNQKCGSPYCYNCGTQGHFGHECNKRKSYYHSTPASPYVIKYENLYEQSTSKKLSKQEYRSSTKHHTPQKIDRNYTSLNDEPSPSQSGDIYFPLSPSPDQFESRRREYKQRRCPDRKTMPQDQCYPRNGRQFDVVTLDESGDNFFSSFNKRIHVRR